MTDPSARDRRSLYRLQYPAAARPVVTVGTAQYAVVEISERGLRLKLSAAKALASHEDFRGSIRFQDDVSLEIRGHVLRADGEDLVIQLTQGISFGRMVTEQMWLHRHYPQRSASGP